METQEQHIIYSTDLSTLEGECEMEFVKASGPGGQHRNKRETGVRLRHVPSGIVVMATERRSQAMNRKLAFERMVARLEEQNEVPTPRVPTSIPSGIHAERLQRKRRQSSKKATRRAVATDED